MTYTPVRDMEMGYHLNFRDPDGIALEFFAPNEAMLSAQRLMAAGGLTETDIAGFIAENVGPHAVPGSS